MHFIFISDPFAFGKVLELKLISSFLSNLPSFSADFFCNLRSFTIIWGMQEWGNETGASFSKVLQSMLENIILSIE